MTMIKTCEKCGGQYFARPCPCGANPLSKSCEQDGSQRITYVTPPEAWGAVSAIAKSTTNKKHLQITFDALPEVWGRMSDAMCRFRHTKGLVEGVMKDESAPYLIRSLMGEVWATLHAMEHGVQPITDELAKGVAKYQNDVRDGSASKEIQT